MNITIAILAGGLATRMKPLTEKFPKALIDINGKPFLEHQLNLLKKQNFTNIVLSVGYEGKQIEDYFGDGQKFGVTIKYSYDGNTLLGTGGALKKALPLLDDVFVVIYGDSYLNIDYRPIVSTFINHNKSNFSSLALMTVYKNNSHYDQSNILFKDQLILSYHKRNPTPDMKYIDWGLGIIHQKAFTSFLSSERFDLADLYEGLVIEKKLMGFEVYKRFYEIGSHQGLEELRQLLKK